MTFVNFEVQKKKKLILTFITEIVLIFFHYYFVRGICGIYYDIELCLIVKQIYRSLCVCFFNSCEYIRATFNETGQNE